MCDCASPQLSDLNRDTAFCTGGYWPIQPRIATFLTVFHRLYPVTVLCCTVKPSIFQNEVNDHHHPHLHWSSWSAQWWNWDQTFFRVWLRTGFKLQVRGTLYLVPGAWYWLGTGFQLQVRGTLYLVPGTGLEPVSKCKSGALIDGSCILYAAR